MAVHDPAPTDADRYPTLSAEGRRMLDFLREHPSAPIFRNESGNRLTADDIAWLRTFERRVLEAKIDWNLDLRPPWLDDFVAACHRSVPACRLRGSAPLDFVDVPTTTRGDLSRDIARFVPDDADLERLINFQTSGTTGHPLLLPSHPRVAAGYLAFHKRALRRWGVTLRHGRGQVGVVLLGWQTRCFTYVSVTPTQDESGLAKINLHPGDWRNPDDRAKYLDALAPEIYAGDPISFAVLLELDLDLSGARGPRALLCTSMTLSDGLRHRLEERFDCPVLDLYSLNEAGPVAVYDAAAGGHVLLQDRLYVEVLDDDDRPVARGQRGEVTLTGGFNHCLPLLRYRTGDHAVLDHVETTGELVLRDLDGRPPVRFRTADGGWLNNIEVTHSLKPMDLVQWTLHQGADGALRLGLVRPAAVQDRATKALRALFGDVPLEVVELASGPDARGGKVVQYTSDLEDAAP